LCRGAEKKGFLMDLPPTHQHVKQNQITDDGCLLFIPSKSVSKLSGGEEVCRNSKIFVFFQDVSSVSFKRVAVVEFFFNIIYKVHCAVGEGEGRHVGQKRTYRKVSWSAVRRSERIQFSLSSTDHRVLRVSAT
jgi:hypothetical protein